MKMKSRKVIKNDARKNVKKNYFRSIIVVFICALFMAGGFSYSTKNILESDFANEEIEEILINKNKLSNTEIIDEILEKTNIQKEIEYDFQNKYFEGILAIFVNEITSSGSIIFGFLNGVNKLVFGEKVEVAVLIFIGNAIWVLVSILFINVLIVGKCRYFLEQRRYRNTKIDKLLFPYKMKKMLHLAYILFLKYLYQFLWNFTIIGGIIKYYEYRMIPYLLSENPRISKNEVFRLSKELVNGKKFELFKLDVSLLGWNLLSVITFKLSSIFFSDVYVEAIYAEIYMELRNEKIDVLTNKELLNDKLLNITEEIDDSYPEEKNLLPSNKVRKWLNVDYNVEYNFQDYIMFFFTFSMIGWIYEVVLTILYNGLLVNKGSMYGPWLPIYGFGGVLILFLLKKFRDKPFRLFLASFILCGIIEYAVAVYFENFRHIKYWDYTGFFLNIKGRICLECLIMFGFGGCAFTYILAPLCKNLYKKINCKIINFICILLVIIFIIDFSFTIKYPRTGEGITVDCVEQKE